MSAGDIEKYGGLPIIFTATFFVVIPAGFLTIFNNQSAVVDAEVRCLQTQIQHPIFRFLDALERHGGWVFRAEVFAEEGKAVVEGHDVGFIVAELHVEAPEYSLAENGRRLRVLLWIRRPQQCRRRSEQR